MYTLALDEVYGSVNNNVGAFFVAVVVFSFSSDLS